MQCFVSKQTSIAGGRGAIYRLKCKSIAINQQLTRLQQVRYGKAVGVSYGRALVTNAVAAPPSTKRVYVFGPGRS